MLSLRGLSLRFPEAAEHLFRDVSFDVRPGEIVSLLARTGGGKSSLLACITGEQRLSQGRVLLDGRDLALLAPYRRADYVALVSQRRGAGIPGHMRVREVLWAFASGGRSRFAFMRRSEAERVGRDLLEPLLPQLCQRLGSQVNTLSAGEYQVLSLACATASLRRREDNRTGVLLLDEHAAHLDSHTASFIMNLTRNAVRQDGLAAVFVTHDLDLANSVSDRIVVLRDGRLVYDGEPVPLNRAIQLVYGRCPGELGLPLPPNPTPIETCDLCRHEGQQS